MIKSYTYEVKGKPLKKPLKNKPLQRIKESDFSINVERDTSNEEIYFTLYINSVLHPAARPRSNNNMKITYDPLASYKNHIIKIIEQFLEENPILKKSFPVKGKISSVIEIGVKPPKSWSNIKKYQAINQYIVYDTYPDLDNVEKTAWDMLSDAHIIWNDKAVVNSTSRKKYCEKDYTEITLNIEPIEKESERTRLTKEENEYIKSLYLLDEKGDDD